MTIVEAPCAVTGGVGTHLDPNVAVALDDTGRLLVAKSPPELLAPQGVGIVTAAALLVVAGDDPKRLE